MRWWNSTLVNRIFSLLILAGFSAGCTRTYISTGDTGVPSPDGSTTRVCWTIHGAYGRTYIEKTGKSVDICIKRGDLPEPRILFLESYRFVASDLDGDAHWTSPEEVVVTFYDFGDGVIRDDARRSGVPSNRIATLTFQLDKSSGKFTEKK